MEPTLFRDSYGDLHMWAWLSVAISVILAIVAVLGTGISVIAYAASKHTCYENIDSLNLEGDFGFWTGCIVTVDGQRIPLDQYFVNNPTDDQ